MFLSFACLGILAGAGWWFWYRNWPDQHPRIAREELDVIAAANVPSGQEERPRWKALLSSRPLVLLLLVAFGYTFMWQFYITWFPTYLLDKYGFTLAEATKYAGLPFIFGLAASWIGGFLTDLLTRRFGVRVARGSLGSSALLVAALLLGCGIFYPDRNVAAILTALAGGFGDLCLGATWASAVDIGGKAAGAVSGLMNSASNVGGFVSPMVFGLVLEKWNNWNTVLMVAVAASALSAFLWLGVFVDGNQNNVLWPDNVRP
jgi:nitrate/nitrite transporter NarK